MPEQSLRDKVLQAAKELLTLEIITTVSDLQFNIDGNSKKISYTGLAPTASAVTRIDIARGDIWTNRSPSTVTGDATAIAEYHERMVEKSEAIIARNFGVLLNVIEKIGEEV